MSATQPNEKIACEVCGELTHAIQLHLSTAHPEMTLAEYQEKFPGKPILSPQAQKIVADKQREAAAAAAAATAPVAAVAVTVGPGAGIVVALTTSLGYEKRPLHETFKLGAVKAAMNAKGEPIGITYFLDAGENADMVPPVDEKYIFPIPLLKTVLMGIETNMPVYLWGHAGTGKSTMFEQVAAHTNRPTIRVQHTVNTEECHILGQWTARDGTTEFELGPLPIAMLNGWIYLADEYDFGLPSVLGVYQPVLEGKALIIKEAPKHLRVIKPHPNFRFCATGNTNGAGDETGLYQGTNIQNAANFERFGIVVEVTYMPKAQEISVVAAQAGILREDAEKLVEFGIEVRKHYSSGKITNTIGPRALINAAMLGMRKQDWKEGICLAFANRLPRTDRESVLGLAQRLFG